MEKIISLQKGSCCSSPGIQNGQLSLLPLPLENFITAIIYYSSVKIQKINWVVPDLTWILPCTIGAMSSWFAIHYVLYFSDIACRQLLISTSLSFCCPWFFSEEQESFMLSCFVNTNEKGRKATIFSETSLKHYKLG